MRTVFGIAFVLFILCYMIAEVTLKRTAPGDPGSLRWFTDGAPSRKVQAGQFNDAHPGVQINVDLSLAGNPEELIVQCCTGAGPDIIDIYNRGAFETLVAAGVLLDVTESAEELGFNRERTYPALYDALTVDGRQYGFPCNVWANAAIYNKAIFDDHGVPYPEEGWTYDDFIAASKQIVSNPSKSGEAHLAIVNYHNITFVVDLLIGSGARVFSEDGLVCTLDSPKAIEAMKLYYDMMFEHGILPTQTDLMNFGGQGGWGIGGLTLFSNERAAMIFIGRHYLVQLPQYPGLGEKLATVTLPRFPGRPSSGNCGCRAAGINVQSMYRQDALAFLQYLASPNYSRLIVADGDSLPPNPELASSGADLVNDVMPRPEFHQAFVDAIENARLADTSPFIDANLIFGDAQWLQEHIQRVEVRMMTPEEAMHSLTREVNQRIRRNLERRPDLQERYEKVTGKPYEKDWWRNRMSDATPAKSTLGRVKTRRRDNPTHKKPEIETVSRIRTKSDE